MNDLLHVLFPCKKTKPAQTVTAGTGGNIARHNGKTIFRKKLIQLQANIYYPYVPASQ